MGGDYDGPGETEENLYRLAEEAVNDAIEKINSFISNDWKEYQSTMEAANLSPFKEISPVDNK